MTKRSMRTEPMALMNLRRNQTKTIRRTCCRNRPRRAISSRSTISPPPRSSQLFNLTSMLKQRPADFRGVLAGKQMVMFFEKPSLRTRLTFEAGMDSLGGSTFFVDQTASRLNARESLYDIAHNLERWIDLIVLRTFSHAVVEEMATYASVPVINALSELEHPCQALADFFTLQEHFGDLKKLHFAYVGDGNNMAHSLLLAGASVGAKVSIATPERYGLNPVIVTMAKAIAEETKASLRILTDPRKAVAGADAVYTDAWASMGHEQEAEERAASSPLPGECRAHATRQAARAVHALPARASRLRGDRPGHRLGQLGRFRSGGKSSAHSESYTRMAVGRRRGPLPGWSRSGAHMPKQDVLKKEKLFSPTPAGSIPRSSFRGSRKTMPTK
jgi:ornithine carbamoyltransferase